MTQLPSPFTSTTFMCASCFLYLLQLSPSSNAIFKSPLFPSLRNKDTVLLALDWNQQKFSIDQKKLLGRILQVGMLWVT